MSISFRTSIILVAAVGVFACGGPKSSPNPQLAEPSQPADPMLAACQAGAAKSCLVAAEAREQAGDLVPAGALYRQACDLGELSGCAFAGGAYAEAGDVDAAKGAFEAGCSEGEPTSCYGLGLVRMGMYGGTTDATAAAEAFESGCGAGLADACGALADLYEAGEGVEKDVVRATGLREQACTAGAPSACTRLGLTALRAEDEGGARDWLAKSCGGDVVDPDGCGWYGWVLYAGIGGRADAGLGTATLQSSCEAESAVGCAFRGAVAERSGDAEAGKAFLSQACELEPAQCEALTQQYEAFVVAE